MRHPDVLDLQITEWATWLVQLVGLVLLVAAAVTALVGSAVAGVGEAELAVLGAALGVPLVFGLQLMGPEAPPPAEDVGD